MIFEECAKSANLRLKYSFGFGGSWHIMALIKCDFLLIRIAQAPKRACPNRKFNNEEHKNANDG